MQHADQPPTGTGHEDDVNTVSAILRGARAASGESLEDVAKQSRISRRYLEALEDGRFHELPGNTYTLGFIRTYADHLNLDSADLVNRYKTANENITKKTKLDFPEPMPETGIPGGTILFAGIILAVFAYGGWYLATEEDGTFANLVSPVPDRLAENVLVADEQESVIQPTTTDAIVETEEYIVPEPSVTEPDTAVVGPVGTEEDVEEVAAESAAVPTVDELIVAAEESQEATEVVASSVEQVVETVDPDPVEIASTVTPEPEIIPDTIVDETVAPNTSSSDVTTEVVDEPVIVEVIQSTIPEEVTEPELPNNTVADVQPIETETQVNEGDVADLIETPDERNARLLNEAQLRVLQKVMEEDDGSGDVQATTDEEIIVESVVVIEPSDNVDIEVSAPVSAIAATTESASNSTPAEPRVYGEEGVSRIVITAKTNSWAEVTDTVSGELLLTRLLKTGDSFHVPDRPGISLITGNAGGLEILVDGQVVPSIGASGDVRRDIALDPELLKSGAAAN